jgi:hypothetical protein
VETAEEANEEMTMEINKPKRPTPEERRSLKLAYKRTYSETIRRRQYACYETQEEETQKTSVVPILRGKTPQQLRAMASRENLGFEMLESLRMGLYRATAKIYEKLIKYEEKEGENAQTVGESVEKP